MLKITITVEDESLNYIQKGEAFNFELSREHLRTLESHYNRRVEMELSKSDVIAEGLSEESF